MPGTMTSVYYLPCRPRSAYINITNVCLNNCLFCIKRSGSCFFGYELLREQSPPDEADILAELLAAPIGNRLHEVVFCGMGEPLLRYDCVVGVCRSIRAMMANPPAIRVDTSGLFWADDQRLEVLEWVDVLSVSLNTENREKYEELCRPRIRRAYEVLMDFLQAVKAEVEKRSASGRFPSVRLSVVDTSEEQFVPESGREGYASGEFPVPDFDACREIAAAFGWQLVVKRLFRDSCDEIWNDPTIRETCARGMELERCRACEYRH